MTLRTTLLALAGLAALAGGCADPIRPVDKLVDRVKPTDRRELAAQAFNLDDPDSRREAIVKLSSHDWGRQGTYLKAYALLTEDTDPLVRSAAVVALGRAGDPEHLPALVGALEDSDPRVRIDAAAALARVHGEAAVEPLRRHASQDANPDVRVRSVEALRHYPRRDVLDTLLAALVDPEFGVRHAARQSLGALTGEEAGYDPRRWSEALSAKDDPFAPPAPAETASRPWWDVLNLTAPEGS